MHGFGKEDRKDRKDGKDRTYLPLAHFRSSSVTVNQSIRVAQVRYFSSAEG